MNGKVALITGRSSGIGRASALLFAKEGANVVIADINDKMGEETIKMGKELAGEIRYVHTDVPKVADLQKMVSEGLRRLENFTSFGTTPGMPARVLLGRV